MIGPRKPWDSGPPSRGKIQSLDQLLIDDEGLKLKPYRDSVHQKLTIGVGRNLDDVGISREEAMFLFRNDRDRAKDAVRNRLPWTEFHDPVRRAVLISMAFQMGINSLLDFKLTLKAVEARRYEDAAEHMLDSRWAKQTPARARRLAEMMRTGEWPK